MNIMKTNMVRGDVTVAVAADQTIASGATGQAVVALPAVDEVDALIGAGAAEYEGWQG